MKPQLQDLTTPNLTEDQARALETYLDGMLASVGSTDTALRAELYAAIAPQIAEMSAEEILESAERWKSIGQQMDRS